MTFQEDKVEEFLKIFAESKNKIRAMEGCQFLELQQDINQPTILMTHSHWNAEQDLNNYRDSELFKTVWAKTKILFSEKTLAFSMNVVDI